MCHCCSVDDRVVIPGTGGTYILVLEVRKPLVLRVGRAGFFEFDIGVFLYVGSAHGPGGLAARLGRHFRRKKTLRWHIDYLRAHTSVVGVYLREGDGRLECGWAAWMAEHAPRRYRGFGASDCACESHLFSVTTLEDFDGLASVVSRDLGAGFIPVGNIEAGETYS